MKNISIQLFILLMIFELVACGGGSGESNVEIPSIPVAQSGIYIGTVTPNNSNSNASASIITSKNDVALINFDTFEVFFGTRSNNLFTGIIYSSQTVSANAELTSVNGNSISGNYSSSLASGIFSGIADINLYSRSSSFEKLEGVWVDAFYTDLIGITTWVIQNNGAFEITSSFGCFLSGNFSLMDSTKNEYEYNATMQPCLGFSGNFSGFAVLDSVNNTDDRMTLVFGNGYIGGLSQPIKQ
ncbi:MAG: hypothetical protein COB38_09555 [Gammaproteobacteria bacterium]|nr:MAG: hypothetical protein COB38_09555 [Gammaproteobacteria bacterium]